MTDKKTSQQVLTKAQRQRMAELVAQLPTLFPSFSNGVTASFIQSNEDLEEIEDITQKCSEAAVKAMSRAMSNPFPHTLDSLVHRLQKSQRELLTDLMTENVTSRETEIYNAFRRAYSGQCNYVALRISKGPEQIITPNASRVH